MTLRRKLLLVALTTLILPWAGWQFVRQTEAVLRQGQEQTLLASASTLARALGALDVEAPAPGSTLYVHPRKDTLRIDGYAGDWQAFRPFAQSFGADNRLEVMLAEDAQWLYLYARARDSTRARADARDPAGLRADHIELAFVRGNETRRYRIASAAPGSFDAPASAATSSLPDRLLGEWQEDGSGYSIELRLPRVFAPERIGFQIHDDGAAGLAVEPLRLLGYSDDDARVLARLAPDSARTPAVGRWLGGRGRRRTR